MAEFLYETMTVVQMLHWKIRVWREDNSIRFGPDKEIVALCKEMYTAASWIYVRDKLVNFPRVNAVEILDATNNGALAYSDWP